jgi:Xaa-Pro aminopeptidase
MRQDLDRLLKERGLDAAVVAGPVHGNPAMYYMTGGAGLTKGIVVKKLAEPAVLLCWPMERGEAAESGLAVIDLGKYDYARILREEEDELAATVALYRHIFDDLAISGDVGFYGAADRGSAWVLLNALNKELDSVTVHGEFGGTLIEAARATKEPDEIARIRAVGRRTCAVVRRTVAFLQSQGVREGILVRPDGAPLTIGHVHEEINQFIAEERLEDPEGFIFSIGAGAGVPHTKGSPSDVVSLGETIVFDIFPREAGGGYFFDMTRTFCLRYAPPEVEQAYQDVHDCLQSMLREYKTGVEARVYQQMACEFFEARGHRTVSSHSQTRSGYVHTLGHGLGLAVHEHPFFRDDPSNADRLEPGHVFTCEPGLYYPEDGFGIRIEDVLYVDESGTVQNLTSMPKSLVIEV